MPIRFRCAYCNQLMGISSRKAGTVVRCPKCAGEIIVPMPEGTQPPESTEAGATGPLAFDDNNFEQNLKVLPNGSLSAAETSTEPARSPAPSPAPAAAPSPPKRLGVFVPLGMLIVSLGVITLLLILMFVLGLIIGRYTMVPSETKTAKTIGATPSV